MTLTTSPFSTLRTLSSSRTFNTFTPHAVILAIALVSPAVMAAEASSPAASTATVVAAADTPAQAALTPAQAALAAANAAADAKVNKANQPAAHSAAVANVPDIPVPPPIPVLRQTTDADLWGRIRNGFAMSDLQSDIVTNQEQWYASRPSYIGRMTERGSKYLYHVVEELERRKMPTELALLPFIESAFNPQAVSSAKAAGMWQFMPATGKHFSLKQSVFRDDRRDVLASTRAALDYLQKLHGMFGDWHLALAAYNWGEGSVQRAIAKNQAAGLGTSYLDLNMPNETRNYVPKLQAVKNIIASPQSFQAELPEIPNHPYFQSVTISRDLDVALAAKLAEINIEDFKSLNPSANKPVIFAKGTPYILLPWDNAGVFERNLAIHNGQTAGWTVWTAPSTMRVADAARRVGMPEAQFREINRIPRGMLIKPGSTLLVPRGANQQQDVSEFVADNGQIGFTPEMVLVRQSFTLRRSESVASLARRYRVSASQLAAWNGVKANGSIKAKRTVTVMVLRPALSAGNSVARAEPERATIVRASFKTGDSDRGGRAVAAAKSQPMAIKTTGRGTAKVTTRTGAKTGAKVTAKPMAKSATVAAKTSKSAARPVIVKKARR
jgi:membrane-bound lytic murein transglycosylase D